MDTTLQQVFDIFMDETEQEYVKRQNILPLLQTLGYIVNEQEIQAVLPYEKDAYTVGEIKTMTEEDAFPLLSKDDVLSAFQAYDINKTGKIPIGVVKSILQAGPEGLSEEEVDATLSLLNPTPEGIVEYTKISLLVSDN
ncbi:hypothetical protein NERG_02036 [Nematocida ausubeli]|uniref:EF-hand domain-containing protein n=1 Tax=Nematocida ausubeli (strain ATCC PRA-371 / ERTm2) TaxID=1913371 RepID=H8ZEL5_NEMA1|nr:hypothetical protein NERG_02036 [Nematocida ausubeli]KAI5135819.1 hypothetical protein NEAUS06_1669 [Nematocida ausubeli]KAI5137743.1 hypothetical protein NEAUS06_2342 [Nematocida ausubeli]